MTMMPKQGKDSVDRLSLELVKRLGDISTRVENGEFRCARGFLSGLNETLQGDALGLLLKPADNTKPTLIRYHVSSHRTNLSETQRNDIDRCLRQTMADAAQEAIDPIRSSWKLGGCSAFSIAQNSEMTERIISSHRLRGLGVLPQRHAKQGPFKNWQSKNFGGMMKHRENRSETAAITVPLFLQRIWPAQGWRIENGMSVWIYMINPCSRFKEDAQVEFFAELQRQLISFIGIWFGSKASVMQNRRWIRHLSPSDGGEFLRALYQKTLVWPISSSDFCNFLDDFTPVDGCSTVDEALKNFDSMRTVTETVIGTLPDPEKHRCVGCPMNDECPQLSWDNQAILAISKLHFWHPAFASHLVGRDERATALRNAVLEGLGEAMQLLDKDMSGDVNFHEDSKLKPSPLLQRLPDDRERRRYERKLLRFWLSRAIFESKTKLGASWSEHALQRQLLEYPAALGQLAIILLADLPWTAERIDILMKALSGYAHQVLGVPGRLDLFAHLRQTLRGETALHTLKQRYRDHFFHTIEVCLIGHCLLESKPEGYEKATFAEHIHSKSYTAKDQALESQSGQGKDAEVLRWFVPESVGDLKANWWLAALSHDTAYGIDVLEGTLKLLSYFKNHAAMEQFQTKVRDCVSSMSDGLRHIAPELKNDRSLNKGDHGVITAGHLHASLQHIGDAELARFMPAVRAVAFHNTRHPTVDAGRDPLAALLILCDTVQDWGRSQLGFARSPGDVLSRIVEGSAMPNDEQFGPVRRYYFSTLPQPSAEGTPWKPATHVWEEFANGAPKLTIRLEYAPWMTDRPDCRDKVLFGWADATFNLQRVNYNPWGLDLNIVQRTPFAQPWKRLKSRLPVDEQWATELERFAAMVRETSAHGFEPWLQAASSVIVDSALGYTKQLPEVEVPTSGSHDAPSASTKCGWEELEFRLNKLGERFVSGNPLMKDHQGKFADALKTWSKLLTPPPDKLAEQKSPS